MQESSAQPTPPADTPGDARADAAPTHDLAPAAGAERPLLPEITVDERDVGWGEAPEQDGDERYLREVPPHHGD